jgi:cysteine-rich repeat protein
VGCGDGIEQEGEACDDGNLDDGDGCDSECESEGCWSLEFDGTDDGVVVPHSNALNLGGTSFTVEAWVWRDDGAGTGNNDVILAKRSSSSADELMLGYTNLREGFFFTIGSGEVVHVEVPDTRTSQWVHVAAVYDADTARLSLWVNGELGATQAGAIAAVTSTAELRMGWDGRYADGYYFDGRMAQVRISSSAQYTTAFTPATTLASDADTIALWNFNAGSGTTASDASGNGHDGTINGATWVEDCIHGNGDTGALIGCGARLGDTCSGSEYCDFPDDNCGATDRPGLCRPRPELCTRELNLVCGCDGAVHSNPCEGRRVGADMTHADRCVPRDNTTPCGFGYCRIELSYCLVTFPGVAAPTTYECRHLPDECLDDPSCECLASESCGDLGCEAREDGGFRITCPRP